MRTVLLICLLAAHVTAAVLVAPVKAELALSQLGKPAATIVLAKEPTRAAQFAACELRWHLKQVTGGDFRIVTDDKPVNGLAILVGDSTPVRAMGIKPDQLKWQKYLEHVKSR